MAIEVSVPRVVWKKLESKKLFYLSKEPWEYLFDEGKGSQNLNSTEIWDVIKSARKSIKGKKGVDDLGQNVVTEIRDYKPVQFSKAKTFLRLVNHHFTMDWDPDLHIHKCIFWIPSLRKELERRSLSPKNVAATSGVSAKTVESLANHYRASLEIARVIVEFVFPGDDPDDHIETTLPERPRMPEPHEGKMDIQRNPSYVLSLSDLSVRPKKLDPWHEN